MEGPIRLTANLQVSYWFAPPIKNILKKKFEKDNENLAPVWVVQAWEKWRYAFISFVM